MSACADICDSDAAMLARLAAMDLSAAERVHAKLMEAEDAADLAELGRTYQRLARSLRQTLILKGKLAKEAAAAAEAAQGRAEVHELLRQAAHQNRIVAHIEPLIVEACERLDEEAYEEAVERLSDRAFDLLEADAAKPGFLTTPPEAFAPALCARLGLRIPDPEPARSPDSGAPAPKPEPPSDYWSSA